MGRADAPALTAKTLAKWLRKQMDRVQEGNEEAHFNRIDIKQILRGNKTSEVVGTFDVPGKPDDDWAESMSMEIYSQLQAEAAVLGGFQRYALFAFMSDDTDRHVSRHVVGIQGTDDEDEEGFASEGTDKAGQVAQQMRHNEVAMKINSAQLMTVTNAQNALITRLLGALEKSEEKRSETLEMVEDLARARNEHELKLLKEHSRAKALEAIGSRVGDMLIPAVANKIMGTNVFQMTGNPTVIMTKAIVTSLMSNPERAEKLMMLLTDEERIAFMNLYEEVSKPDKDKEKEGKSGNGLTTKIEGTSQ